jgi:hypothetical protein
VSPYTVEARAARFQRRFGGSPEFVRLNVAVHDLERELARAFRPSFDGSFDGKRPE